MSSMKTYLLVWLGGVIAGVIIMERWRRTGRGLIPTAASRADAIETTNATAASVVPADKPKVSAALIAGAKADADRFRHFVRRVTPGPRTRPPRSCVGGVERLQRAPPTTLR